MKKKKQQHWRKIKQDFIDVIPANYKIEYDWGHDESEFYHPFVRVNDEISITSQCGLGTGYIYAIRAETKLSINGLLKTYCIDFELEDLRDFFDNDFGNINIAENILEVCKDLEVKKDLILQTQEDLMIYSYFRELKGLKNRKTEKQIKLKLENLIEELN